MNISSNDLENELLLIVHHVEDACEGLDKGDTDYTKNSLKDIKESLVRLISKLPQNKINDIEDIAGKIE